MPVPGHVYILKNSRVPSLVKVGMTNDLQRRLAELNAHAGVGGRWAIAGYVITDDMATLESATHRKLGNYRDHQSGGTEMFECSDDVAGAAILQAAATADVFILKDALPSTIKVAVAEQEANAKKQDLQRLFDKQQEMNAWRAHFDANVGALACQVRMLDGEKATNKKNEKSHRHGTYFGLFIAVVGAFFWFNGPKGNEWWVFLLGGLALAGWNNSKAEEFMKLQPSLSASWQLLFNRAHEVFGREDLHKRLNEEKKLVEKNGIGSFIPLLYVPSVWQNGIPHPTTRRNITMPEYWIDAEKLRSSHSDKKAEKSAEERYEIALQRALEDEKADRRKGIRDALMFIGYFLLQAWLVSVTFPTFLPPVGLTQATLVQTLASFGFGFGVMGFIHWLYMNQKNQ